MLPYIGCMMILLGTCGLEEVEQNQAAVSTELKGVLHREGPPQFELGIRGGSLYSTIENDPKTFNTLTARDADTRAVIDVLMAPLATYDPYKKEFIPHLADFKIEIDDQHETMRVLFTLRNDVYWTNPSGTVKKQLTADDFIFWYDEVEGDPLVQHPGYPNQFVDMPDGSTKRIIIEKIDTFTFAFIYPRIVANPILSSNMKVGPRFVFQTAKEEGGVEAMLNLLSIDGDVRNILSMGPFHIWEYEPGVKVVLKRNPYYWEKDSANNTLPYIDYLIYKIVPDQNTSFLLFKNNKIDVYSPRPEDLDILLKPDEQERNYAVYEGGESLRASFFTVNQNPNTVDSIKYSWFSKAKFRQALSCLLDRDRIAQNVYRGLAKPAEYFFARANMYFDPAIKLEYTFNPEHALRLLNSIHITKAEDGLLYDENNNHIEFNLFYGNENTIIANIASIYAETLRSYGITLHQRGIDFQNLVARLTQSYDWDMVIVALSANYWPSGGSNVWQSNGNFHVWYPLQTKPATDWERRIDYLYNKGRFTVDKVVAKKIYDEYQRIILTQLPIIYVVYPYSYLAIRSKWKNVFYDSLDAFQLRHLFLAP